jgi:hypothetical protein
MWFPPPLWPLAFYLIRLVVPTNPTEFWTFVTAVASLVLLFVAWRGLRSLVLTQKDMLTRATREARQCAIARAEEWAQELIPANQEILNKIAQHKVPVFVRSAAEVRFNPDNMSDVQRGIEWWNKTPEEVVFRSIHQLNAMEAWAMYFTSGLADSDLAFGPCAPTFCRMVIQNYALLLVLRSNNSSGVFPNTVTLYQAWLQRLEEEKRGKQAEQLLRQLQELQQKGSGHPVSPPATLPKPLGMD